MTRLITPINLCNRLFALSPQYIGLLIVVRQRRCVADESLCIMLVDRDIIAKLDCRMVMRLWQKLRCPGA